MVPPNSQLSSTTTKCESAPLLRSQYIKSRRSGAACSCGNARLQKKITGKSNSLQGATAVENKSYKKNQHRSFSPFL